jgi:hypothetical protein
MCALKGVQERGYQAVAAGFQLHPRVSVHHARSVSNVAALVYEPLCIRHSNMLYRCLSAARNTALRHAWQMRSSTLAWLVFAPATMLHENAHHDASVAFGRLALLRGWAGTIPTLVVKYG